MNNAHYKQDNFFQVLIGSIRLVAAKQAKSESIDFDLSIHPSVTFFSDTITRERFKIGR